MKKDIKTKILEELQKEHRGEIPLQHSNALRIKGKKVKKFSQFGDICEGQRSKVIRVTDTEYNNHEK